MSLLTLTGITKAFGPALALNNVDFQIGENEIVGLLGDNGAGKSTLVKVITGYHRPDRGTLTWQGQPLKALSVRQARALGIEVVYQERALADQQALWRNIFAGRELTRGGLLDAPRMRRETRRLMYSALGFTSAAVTPDSPVGKFSGGERQGVAITRALYFSARLIILDEPTMGLSLAETRKCLDFIAGIKAAGKSCLLIDHNVFHVYANVDRIVVLDRGRVAGQFARDALSLDDLIAGLHRVAQSGSFT